METAGAAVPNADVPDDVEKEKDGAPPEPSELRTELSNFWPKLKETPAGGAGFSAAAVSFPLNEKSEGAALLPDAPAPVTETDGAAPLLCSPLPSPVPSDAPLPYFFSMLARCRS